MCTTSVCPLLWGKMSGIVCEGTDGTYELCMNRVFLGDFCHTHFLQETSQRRERCQMMMMSFHVFLKLVLKEHNFSFNDFVFKSMQCL